VCTFWSTPLNSTLFQILFSQIFLLQDLDCQCPKRRSEKEMCNQCTTAAVLRDQGKLLHSSWASVKVYWILASETIH
jgi:hypothetical protein